MPAIRALHEATAAAIASRGSKTTRPAPEATTVATQRGIESVNRPRNEPGRGVHRRRVHRALVALRAPGRTLFAPLEGETS